MEEKEAKEIVTGTKNTETYNHVLKRLLAPYPKLWKVISSLVSQEAELQEPYSSIEQAETLRQQGQSAEFAAVAHQDQINYQESERSDS